MLGNDVEQAGDGGHRGRQDNECLVDFGALQGFNKVIADVVPFVSGGAGCGRGTVIPVNNQAAALIVLAALPRACRAHLARLGEGAQQRTADEAEAEDANGAGNFINTHLTSVTQNDYGYSIWNIILQ